MIITAELIPFGAWIQGKITDKGFEYLQEKLVSIDKKDKFYRVVLETTKAIQEKYPDVLGGSISYFFNNEVIFSELIKILFFDSKVDINIINEQLDIQTLPDGFTLEFVELLKTNLFKEDEFHQILVNKELYAILLELNTDLNSICSSSNSILHEITKWRELTEDKNSNAFRFDDFKNEYLANAQNTLSQVSFIGLGLNSSIKKGRRKKITDLFIKPTFSISNESIKAIPQKLKSELIDENLNIKFSKLFSFEKNLIILGQPGSGKSFLIKYIICSLIDSLEDEFENKDMYGILPFRIELRNYLTFKKDAKSNIIKYLSIVLEEEYGICNIAENFLIRIFKTQKTVIFFDGLDEIFNIEERLKVKNDIEFFCNIYKDVRIVATSRIIGYEDANLNSQMFIELKINNFDNFQQDAYVTKWYEIEEDDEKIREKEIKDFLNKKNHIDKELIRNPLLLSLIVILYRNNLKLPDSKLEVYRSCTSTLVDKWDASKQLNIDMDEEIHRRKDTIFADLAYWQYNELSKNEGKITYELAKSVVGKTIVEKLELADEFNFDDQAENFMEYAKKRSIYFDNNFTHKTFLEYYTAYWIYTNIEKKHKQNQRNELIGKYISNSFWHIVLELLLNLIDKDQPDNEIIDEIIDAQVKTQSPHDCVRFFLNILPTLQNISTNKIAELYLLSIEFLLKQVEDYHKKVPNKKHEVNYLSEKKSNVFFELLLHFSNDRLRQNIKNTLIEYHKINSNKNLVLFYRLYYELIYSGKRHNKNDEKEKQIKCFFSKQEILPIITQDAELFRFSLLIEDYTTMDELLDRIKSLIELFGKKSALEETKSIFANYKIISFVNIFIINLINNESIDNYSKYLTNLTAIGIENFDLLHSVVTCDHPLIWENDCNKIVHYLNLNLSEDSNKLIFVLLNKYINRRTFLKNRIDTSELLSAITRNDEHKKLLNSIIKATNEQNGLDIICSHFKIENNLQISRMNKNQPLRFVI
jgi:hypothetical protein